MNWKDEIYFLFLCSFLRGWYQKVCTSSGTSRKGLSIDLGTVFQSFFIVPKCVHLETQRKEKNHETLRLSQKEVCEKLDEMHEEIMSATIEECQLEMTGAETTAEAEPSGAEPSEEKIPGVEAPEIVVADTEPVTSPQEEAPQTSL